jgi:tetratricopeptide (TPR) repeat protein
VQESVAKLESKPGRVALAIAAAAASEGSEAALNKSLELTSDEKSRMEALSSAANKLLWSRIYKPTPDLLAKVNTGDSSLELIDGIRTTKHYEDIPVSEKDPASVVQKFLTLMAGPSKPDEKLLELLVPMKRKDRPGRKPQPEINTYVSLGRSLRNATSTDIPQDARGDLLLSHLKFVTDGSDQIGYRVTAQSFGIGGVNFYVVKLNGQYRVVPFDQTERFAGNLVLEKSKAGQLDAARKWLEWMRENVNAPGEDDPLDGPLITHFWRKGQMGDKDAIANAAAALIVSGDQVEPAIPILVAGRRKASTDQEKLYFDQALFSAYVDLEQWEEAKPLAEAVHAAMPSSPSAFKGLALVLAELKQWKASEQLAKERLAKDEHDMDAIEILMDSVERQGKFEDALKLASSGLNETKPRASLMNNYAWDSLFVDPLPKDAVEVAQRGSRLLENRDFGVLHTLSCIYAELGRTGEARQLIVQAMEAAELEEPESNVWYVFGRIAEQYGRQASAQEAYARVEEGRDRPNSTFQLAQKRLRSLKISAQPTKVAKN